MDAKEPSDTATGGDTDLTSAAPHFTGDVSGFSSMLLDLAPSANADEAQQRITLLERLTATIAAVQAGEAVALHAHRVAEDTANQVPVHKRGTYAGHEVAYAKNTAPASGRRFLSTAHALVDDLPHTFAALARGDIPQSRARTVAERTAGLTHEQRVRIDDELKERLTHTGNRRLSREVRALAYQARADDDPAFEWESSTVAVDDRHVSFADLEDGMARISAVLPLVEGVAVVDHLQRSALSRLADGEAAGRTEKQLMADLFVERLTGQGTADDVPVEVAVVIEAESLFSDGRVPAWLPGFGPLPAKTAREFLVASDAQTFLRRVFTSPRTGQLVGMDSKSRKFTGQLRKMVIFRDDVCRSPGCDAPIKHVDHAQAVAAGGTTEWENASGLCAACNYAKEKAGWRHEATPETLIVTTPTGKSYRTDTPPLVTKLRARGRSTPSNRDGPPRRPGGEVLTFEVMPIRPDSDDAQPPSTVESIYRERVLRDTG